MVKIYFLNIKIYLFTFKLKITLLATLILHLYKVLLEYSMKS
jgi:hypothetical protein